MARLPLWVEVSGRHVLVVGGGNVGTRRALWFLEAGAEVVVAALEFSGKLREAASRSGGRLRLVKLDAKAEPQRLRELVEWADIVVIATDNAEVNELVWRLARELRRWVNDATNASRTELVVPYTAKVYGGGLSIAVTSEGLTGVAARHARDYIVECLESNEKLRVLFQVMAAAKKTLKELEPNPKKRLPVYFALEEELTRQPDLLSQNQLPKALEAAARVIAEKLGTPAGAVAEKLREKLEELNLETKKLKL